MSRRLLWGFTIGVASLVGCSHDSGFSALREENSVTSRAAVARVKARTALLKEGQTEDQVMWLLAGLPLGERTVVAASSCGGEVARSSPPGRPRPRPRRAVTARKGGSADRIPPF